MPNQTINVFVSYSHTDATLVAPVVKLLRANRSFVFQDIDSIQPGKKWRSEIEKGLVESDLVVVFWCNHASRSDEVCKEWKAAIEQEKDLLPLLLDATPLPPELGDFQWIDFRATVGGNHALTDSPPEYTVLASPAKESRSGILIATVLLAVLMGGILFTWYANPPARPTLSSLPEIADRIIISDNKVLLAIFFTATSLFVRGMFLQWGRKARSSHEVTPMHSSDISQIAQEIEEEILRRKDLKCDAGA